MQESLHLGTGLYTATVPQDDATEQFVEIDRTIPGSTIWYGASAVVPSSPETAPTLYLSSSSDGTGDSCVDYEGVGSQVDQGPLSTTLFSTNASAACRKGSSSSSQASPRARESSLMTSSGLPAAVS